MLHLRTAGVVVKTGVNACKTDPDLAYTAVVISAIGRGLRLQHLGLESRAQTPSSSKHILLWHLPDFPAASSVEGKWTCEGRRDWGGESLQGLLFYSPW